MKKKLPFIIGGIILLVAIVVLKRQVVFDSDQCKGCGACMEQAFCNVVKEYVAGGSNSSCEGCGLCAQLCRHGALKMQGTPYHCASINCSM